MEQNTGSKKPLEDDVSMRIKQKGEDFNKDKLKSLYIAYKDINKDEFEKPEKLGKDNKLIDEYDLVLSAVFGIKDSFRDGVKKAIKKRAEASLNVIMIVTVTSIANVGF